MSIQDLVLKDDFPLIFYEKKNFFFSNRLVTSLVNNAQKQRTCSKFSELKLRLFKEYPREVVNNIHRNIDYIDKNE